MRVEECFLQQTTLLRSLHNEAREPSLQSWDKGEGTSSLAQAATPLNVDRPGTTSYHERYVDPQEAAAFLCLHPKTLMRLAREDKVPAYTISEGSRRHWRFLISELDMWMRSKVNSTPHPVHPRPANERSK